VQELKNSIRDIIDFPQKGIVFKDITTLLANKRHFHRTIDIMAHRYLGQHIDMVVGVEARGFILGSALAYKLGAGIALVRKPGKLPHKTIQKTYALEYGTDCLEIHADAFKPGERVLIVDDLLATGGTVAAAVDLVSELEAEIVECAFLVELDFLKGRERLSAVEVFSLLQF